MTTQKTTRKTKKLVDGLVDGLVENYKLSTNQGAILKMMLDNEDITIAQLADKVSISTTAIDKNIIKLKEFGLLRRVGPDKGGHWEVIDDKD
jgi:ATP-dependent DNA helicase RecG